MATKKAAPKKAAPKKAAPKKAAPKKAAPKKAAPVTEPEVDEAEGQVEATAEQPTAEQLIALGEEINAQIFPDEPVDFQEILDNGGIDQLIEQITTDAGSIEPTDNFTDEAKATLEAIGVEIEWKTKAPAKEKEAAGEKKTKAPAKEKKAAGEKKGGVAKNKWGHRVGTMTDVIDNCLEKGTTAEDCAAAILEKFPHKTSEAALRKFRANVAAYKEGVTFTEKTGKYKMAA